MNERRDRVAGRWLRLELTRAEVALDDHLVLLLIPPGDDQVVLCADEPQELLKPVNGSVKWSPERSLWSRKGPSSEAHQ